MKEVRQLSQKKMGKIATAGLACGCIIASCMQYMDPAKEAEDCQSRIEKEVDPGPLQNWATNLLATYSLARTNYNGPFPLPSILKRRCGGTLPSISTQGADGREEAFVYVVWGAAVGHWGISVGSPTFTPAMPEHGDRPWKPGIYFWKDLH